MTTNKPFTTNYRHYGEITVPAGTRLTNKNAVDTDVNVFFVDDFAWIDANYPDFSNILRMDAESYGIIVPASFVSNL